MVGKFSYSPQTRLSRHHWMLGGEILLLLTTCQMTTTEVQPGASKRISQPCSLVIQSVVGRFSSPQAGHLPSFGAWWRVKESPHHAPNDDERVQIVLRKKISHHALNDDNRAWWANSLTHPRLDSLVIVGCLVGEILLLPTTCQTTTEVQLGRVRESPNHALSSFRAWWGDSPTHPRLDICRRRLAHSGE